MPKVSSNANELMAGSNQNNSQGNPCCQNSKATM